MGAATGALGQCILLIVGIGPIWIRFFLGFFLIDMLMIFIGLRIEKLYFLVMGTVGFMGINVILTGGVEFIQYEIRNMIPHTSNMLELLVIFYISGWILMGALHGVRKGKKTQLYQVILNENENHIEVQALLDTGNGLRDPIFGRPVSIIEEGLVEYLKPFETQPGFCMIPYHSQGRENGIMPGILVHNIRIRGKLEEKKVEQIMIGIYHGEISSDHQYQMILHPKLLQN